MEITVNTQLNPSFEILGLIHMHHHSELLEMPSYVRQVKELGLNPEELYKKHGILLKRYLSEFEKQLILEDADKSFFDEKGIHLLVFLQILLAEVPEWVANIESIQDEEVLAILIEGIGEWLSVEIKNNASIYEIIEALKESGLPANPCWKVMLLLQEPKKHISHLVNIVRRNTPAYHHAIQAIDKPLQRQMERFIKKQHQHKARRVLMQDTRQRGPAKAITPTLIYPMLEAMSDDTIYMGIFIDDLYQMIDNLHKARNSNNPVIKALSDSSKFDILLSLHNSPKYNLELAEHLRLTPATITHHMQTLLLHGLVSVEKRDGRVYYTLQKDVIAAAVTQIKELFSL